MLLLKNYLASNPPNVVGFNGFAEMKNRRHHNNKGYRQIKNGTLVKQTKIFNKKYCRRNEMDTQRQNLDLEIGTVEPIISDDVFGFIMGAIQKYKDNPDYHKSLSKYIMQQLNQRELANPVENRVRQGVLQSVLRTGIEEKYNELIMAVAKKFTNETRHQTALRYINEAESFQDNSCAKNESEQSA